MEPSQLFDRLFGVTQNNDGAEAIKRSRLLDTVLQDAQSLRNKLGARDKIRLEAHLEHLYAMQNRIEASTPACNAPNRPLDNGDLIAKATIMGELLATAVSCGLTRVFSFMLTSPASTHVFDNIGVPDGMHKTCHDGHWERVRDITTYQMQAFAAFADGFAVESITGETLLDRGLIYGTSEYGEGWKHSVKELPVVILGTAHNRLNDATHVRVPNGNISDAQLTALNALGLSDTSFGWNGAQSTQPFAELLS